MNKIIKTIGIAAMLMLAVITVQAQNTQVLTAALPTAQTTNNSGVVTNSPTPTFVAIHNPPLGFNPNLAGVAIFPVAGGMGSGTGTNTFTFVNSYDGVTPTTTNTWTVTLVVNGTNIAQGYTWVPATNFAGATAFSLQAVTTATNGFTNGALSVRFPY